MAMCYNSSMKTCLLLAFFLFALVPAYAVDMTAPASVQVTVQDKDGHPLPQATVTLGGENVVLDAAGKGRFETRSPQPAPDIFWTEHLVVTQAGFLPYETDIRLFPGAQFELPIALFVPQTTSVHLRGPNGEILAGISFEITYEAAGSQYAPRVPGRTDAHGDFVFTHPPLKAGSSFSVSSPGWRFGSHDYSDAASVTVTLKADEMPPSFPPHPLHLTLLDAEGKPAAGWQVASHVSFTGSEGAFSSIISRSMLTNYYTVSGLVLTDKDGVVSLPQAEDHLAVISPQGVPFLYPLHPQTWLDGLHSVTLRLPAMHRAQIGRVTLPDGKPAAGFPVTVARAVTGGQQWELILKEPVGTILTDTAGQCVLPQYFGTTYQYESRKPPLYAYDLATPDGSVLHSYGTPDALKPSEYKEVRLLFVDENGKPVPEFAADSVTAFQGSRQVSSQGGGVPTDRNGSHLFLPNAVDRVTIAAQAQNWNPLTKTLDLPGTGGKTFTLTVPQSLHFKPLSGVLLDPLARPLVNISVNLHKVNRYASDINYPEGSTMTDAQGRFAFAAAPDSSMINLYRPNSGDNDGLPGWIDPPRVTPQTRHLTLRLRPFLASTVRVLLPPTVTTEPKEVYLESAPAKDELPDYLIPTFDPKTHTLLWNRIPPGTYTLTTASAKLPVAARISQPVMLKAQGETRIDLRDKAASFPQPPKPGTIDVYLTNDQGQPLSGVAVTLWTDQEVWERHFPADLTDNDGKARLPLGIGERGVLVAHVAGKLIGYAEVTGQQESSISIPMNAAQTLTVPLTPLPLVNGKPPYDSREVSLRPVQMKPDEAEAVFLVLGLLNADTGVLSDGPVPTVSLHRDTNGNCVAEDLPPGTYHLETGSDITLPLDNAASEIPLP